MALKNPGDKAQLGCCVDRLKSQPIADISDDGLVSRIPFEKGKKKALTQEAQHWWP